MIKITKKKISKWIEPELNASFGFFAAIIPYTKEHNITIDDSNLNQLPEIEIPSDLTYINDNQTNFNPDTILVDSGPTLIVNENSEVPTEECDDNYHAFDEGDDDQPLQIDNIKTAINFPTANKTAINEFAFDSLATLVFPKLFPLGLADPTTKGKFENELINILYIFFSNNYIFFS